MEDSKPKVRGSAEKSAGNRGKGRKKGVPNKVTKELKEMILGALDKSGGEEYLVKQAEDNPNAFLTLVGKVLPMTVQGAGENGAFEVTITRRVIGADDKP